MGLFPAYPDLASTAARIVLGIMFMVHGLPKVRDLRKTIGWVAGTKFPGGASFALVFSLLEFFGSIALLLGFLTQIVAVLFVLEMTATTIFSKTKLGKKLVLGYELDIAYLGLAAVLALLGPGPWSLDRLLGIA